MLIQLACFPVTIRAPFGIEIKHCKNVGCGVEFLIIAPFGIEIAKIVFVQFDEEKLIIAPFGIEIGLLLI